jgi:hypothetical protein
MTQQITITADAPVEIRPLLESAIQGQSRTLALGLRRTRERIEAFELRHGMSSFEFERRFTQRDLPETLEYIEWLGELRTLRLLEDQQQALSSLRIQ